MEVKHFFFYGNLMSSFPSHEKLLKPYTLSVRKASTNGQLYHLSSGYPVMTLGEDKIKGEIMLLKDTKTLITYLDVLKGYYGPGRKENHYERIIQLIQIEETGEKILAYVYVCPSYMLEEVEVRGIMISDGDWGNFMTDLRNGRKFEGCSLRCDA